MVLTLECLIHGRSVMLSHKQMKAQMLSEPAVKREYDRLAEEFVLVEELVQARLRSGLSQAEVAKRMGTKSPAISRIESADMKHSPSLRTLRKYAAAVGCRLEFRLKPAKAN
jgi:ribosome-binding protein aMBF1 (putative translation factor)